MELTSYVQATDQAVLTAHKAVEKALAAARAVQAAAWTASGLLARATEKVDRAEQEGLGHLVAEAMNQADVVDEATEAWTAALAAVKAAAKTTLTAAQTVGADIDLLHRLTEVERII